LSVQKYTWVPMPYFPFGGSIESKGTRTAPAAAQPQMK